MSNKKTIWSGIVGIFSSILAFLGVVTCCGMPIVAGVLATFGIGASQLEFFAAYRWWFIAIAVVALIIGFYQSYFRKCKCDCGCGSGDSEDARKRKRAVAVQRIFLWIGVAAVAFAIFSGTPKPADSQPCCTENSQAEPSPCCGQSSSDTDNAPACCGSSTSDNAGECCGAAPEPTPSCNSCGN